MWPLLADVVDVLGGAAVPSGGAVDGAEELDYEDVWTPIADEMEVGGL